MAVANTLAYFDAATICSKVRSLPLEFSPVRGYTLEVPSFAYKY
jgi:hypothetical protein